MRLLLLLWLVVAVALLTVGAVQMHDKHRTRLPPTTACAPHCPIIE